MQLFLSSFIYRETHSTVGINWRYPRKAVARLLGPFCGTHQGGSFELQAGLGLLTTRPLWCEAPQSLSQYL